MQSQHFSLPIRVYYQDTDAGGVVYHSTHLNFMERARYEWLRNMGFDVHELINIHKLQFMVRSIEIEYFRPAILDDLLHINVNVIGMGRSRISIAQEIRRDQTRLVNATVHVVCVSTESLRPIRIPPHLREKIETPT
ncbi:MAG: tol-pal system-associated acyl-CoA thioesterase [Nitrosomonas sp.]|nr:tol-pal system-associated acyl-CoA thioesterase [Nitrosomonas sp.]MCP5252347.1 tol-pal system-associated acyl-CoA thioesterase [Burkholderiales bacterium]MDR4521186.1 tol-pal system-associated acyl-CoA thioesterase [Nitrosomonas sp.]